MSILSNKNVNPSQKKTGRKFVLITRPLHSAKEFAERIDRFAVPPYIEPMLSIEPAQNDFSVINTYDFCIFTSANAVRHFDGYITPAQKDAAQCLAVGPATAAALGTCGYKNVVQTGQNVSQLLQHLKELNDKPERDRPISTLYVRGEQVTQDFAADHGDAYGRFDSLIVYRAVAQSEFSAGLLQALQTQQIEVATFFSVRSRMVFEDLAVKHGVQNTLAGIKLLCISESVLRCVRSEHWLSAVVSQRADSEGMAMALQRMYT